MQARRRLLPRAFLPVVVVVAGGGGEQTQQTQQTLGLREVSGTGQMETQQTQQTQTQMQQLDALAQTPGARGNSTSCGGAARGIPLARRPSA